MKELTATEYQKSITPKVYNGLTKNRNNATRDWRFCPRCNKKAINKEMRRCNACGGRVFWEYDTVGINNAIERMDGFFIWHRSINGIIGWFDQSYWNISYKVQ